MPALYTGDTVFLSAKLSFDYKGRQISVSPKS